MLIHTLSNVATMSEDFLSSRKKSLVATQLCHLQYITLPFISLHIYI